jgi:hypothetical protein
MEDHDTIFYQDFKMISKLFDTFKITPDIKIINKFVSILQRNSILDINCIVNNYSLLHFPQEYETMKYLLDLKADVNLANHYHITPIFTQKSYDTIKLLVDNGASLRVENEYHLTPLFWQKEPKAMKYLLDCGLSVNYFNNSFNINRNYPIEDIYSNMLISGGYDPYNEMNISISPLFLQRDYETQKIMLEWCFSHEPFNFHTDLFLETPLFKVCINEKIVELYLSFGEDINHKNVLGNTLLFIHTDPKIILCLLRNNIDLTSRNVLNDTAYQYHFKRKNYYICDLIKEYYSCCLLQRNWKRYKFRKNYTPLKNYKKKQELIHDLVLLPPSECGIFPGGSKYQDAFIHFNELK